MEEKKRNGNLTRLVRYIKMYFVGMWKQSGLFSIRENVMHLNICNKIVNVPLSQP